MTNDTSAKVKFGLWGMAAGAAGAMIVGFMWGGWVTGGTAKELANKAVLASEAKICSAQFMNQPNSTAKLKELTGTNSWERSDFIGKGGWDKMPGQAKAGDDVARACAEGLAKS